MQRNYHVMNALLLVLFALFIFLALSVGGAKGRTTSAGARSTPAPAPVVTPRRPAVVTATKSTPVLRTSPARPPMRLKAPVPAPRVTKSTPRPASRVTPPAKVAVPKPVEVPDCDLEDLAEGDEDCAHLIAYPPGSYVPAPAPEPSSVRPGALVALGFALVGVVLIALLLAMFLKGWK